MEFTVTKWIEILNYLHENKFRNDNYISNIAKKIDISYDYTYKVLEILKHKSLVKKVQEKHNKRKKYIVLTKKGEKLAEHCFEVVKIKNRLMKNGISGI